MSTGAIGNLIGIAGIVIGLVTSIYFYQRSIRVKEPRWAIVSNNLINDYGAKLDLLKVSYDNKNVNNLTISRLSFYNNGAETIDASDIKTKNPLRIIALNGAKILNAKLVFSTSESCNFSIDMDKIQGSVNLHFDYVDKNQGLIIEVIHTGTGSDDLLLTGDIKGARKIQQIAVNETSDGLIPRLLLPSKTLTISSLVLGALYAFLGPVVIFYFRSIPMMLWAGISFSIFGIAFLVFAVQGWIKFQSFPKGL